jgi:hypothetical protein
VFYSSLKVQIGLVAPKLGLSGLIWGEIVYKEKKGFTYKRGLPGFQQQVLVRKLSTLARKSAIEKAGFLRRT